MQQKHEIDLSTALEISDSLNRRAAIVDFINQGACLTTELLEKALTTYDSFVIKKSLEYAIKIGLTPTTKCLSIMIEHRAEVTKKACENVPIGGGFLASCYSIYALQAQTIQTLIEAGALVTRDVVEKSVSDDKKFGTDTIRIALLGKDLEASSLTLKNEFNRLSEIKNTSSVLAQASRSEIKTSFFSTLPPELLIGIASLTGRNDTAIAENKLVEIAYQSFSKPK